MSERQQAIQRFAAFLTHLFNATDSPGSEVVLNYGQIYHSVVTTLARNNKYAKLLLGAAAGGNAELDGPAEKYFDHVVNKGIATGSPESSSTIKLLLGLLARSAVPLCRTLSARLRAGLSNSAIFVDAATRGMAEHLAKIAAASETSLALAGPGEVFVAPLPERLSLWETMTAPPPRIRRLSPGNDLNALHNLTLEAFKSANRHFYEFLSLGLDPYEWMERVGVNQAKEIGRLCRHAQTLSEQSRFAAISDRHWLEAWNDKKIAGFKTVEKFLDSEIGKELRGLTVRSRSIPIEDVEASLEDESAEALPIKQDEINALLGRAEKKGVISPYIRTVLLAIAEGGSLRDFMQDEEFAASFGRQGAKIERSLEDLRARLQAFAKEEDGD